jgi:hypothetical protein
LKNGNSNGRPASGEGKGGSLAGDVRTTGAVCASSASAWATTRSPCSSRATLRWTFAPARSVSTDTVRRSIGTGRRKSTVIRATGKPGAAAASARARSAAGGPPC